MLSLTTEQLPKGVDGVLSATGVGTTAPAFEGDIKVVVNGITVDVPVVAVDGDVWATLPFTKNFVQIDPEDYGAPDPADLLNTDGGVSSLVDRGDRRVGRRRGPRRRPGAHQLHRHAARATRWTRSSPRPTRRRSSRSRSPLTDDGLLAAADAQRPVLR